MCLLAVLRGEILINALLLQGKGFHLVGYFFLWRESVFGRENALILGSLAMGRL
jgi:hypothetical protein